MAVINGTAANNTLVGTNDADQINGLAGNDTINPLGRFLAPVANARDVVDGGDGTDTLVIDASGETQVVQLGTGGSPRFVVTSTSNNFFVEAYNMELVKFTGGSGNDIINTGDSGGTIDGGGGTDFWIADLGGLVANVTFTLGTTTKITAAGLSSILGVERIDLTTGSGNDKIVGGGEADAIRTGDGDDSIDARTRPSGGGSDFVDGGAGTDTLVVDASTETLSVTLNAGFSPSYGVTSASGNFQLEAYNIELVKFSGGSGDDFINTGSGGVTVNGGGGNDLWLADLREVASNINFTLGTTTSIAAAGLTSILGIERITLSTGLGNDTITGGDLLDWISTGAGDDVINLRKTTGADFADGGLGTDTLVVDASTETQAVSLNAGFNPAYSVNSVSGRFNLEAYNVEKVRFKGGGGNDFINTGRGGVTVDGAGGNDFWVADLSQLSTDVSFELGVTTAIASAGLTSILGIEQISLETGYGDDTLTGGAFADNLKGGAGDDVINARTRSAGGGIDVVDGGDGIDTLVVDASAEAGSVSLGVALNPSYFVDSASGNFDIDASGIEKVKFIGGAGNDFINTGRGGIEVHGGGGTDFWLADLSQLTAAVTFVLGTTAALSQAGLTAISGIERIDLTTGSGKDVITGGAFDDRIVTGAGDDIVDARTRITGIDVVDGGAGIDMLVVDGSAETQGMSLGIGLNPNYFVNSVSDHFRVEGYSIEKVKFTGGAGDDFINTGRGGVEVHGGGGTDFWLADLSQLTSAVTFALGTTTAITRAGLTAISGIERIDLITGSGKDVITGGAFDDRIVTGAGDDIIDARTRVAGTDVVDGGAGIDTLVVDGSAETQSMSLGVGLNPNYFVGSVSERFRVEGYSIEKVKFTGGAGDDFINTGRGGVTVDGGAGSDFWIADLSQLSAAVSFRLGVTQSIAAAGLTSILNIERMSLTTGSGADTLTGGALADQINGGAGNDIINLGTRSTSGGIDSADGGSGTDTLVVDASDETTAVMLSTGLNPTFAVSSVSGNFALEAYGMERAVFTGGRGNDIATGLSKDDVLTGGRGNDILVGGDGDDSIDGGAHEDLIRGGRGADLLTGGTSSDVFDYDLLAESSAVSGKIDTITDFLSGVDKIDLSGIDADNRAVTGDQAFIYIAAAVFTGVRGELRSTAGLVEADLNGDQVADFRITLGNGATALAGDFVL